MTAMDFPANPVVGMEFEGGGTTYVWNGYGWTIKPVEGGGGGLPGDSYTKAESDARYLHLTGGELFGNLTITASYASVVLNKIDGSNQIAGYNNAALRWVVSPGDSATESGGNVGSDFAIARFTDAGVAIDNPFVINRATGTVSIPVAPTMGNHATNKTYVDTLAVGKLDQATADLRYLQLTGGTVSGLITAPAKGHTFGVASGTISTGAVTPADANIKMYDFGGGNWCGFGTDANGGFWLRTGLGGTPTPAFVIDTLRNAQIAGTLTTAGYQCRGGTAGGYYGTYFNIDGTAGKPGLYIDTTYYGMFSLTPSDYRIKRNVADISSMWETVKALRPITYNYADYTPPAELDRSIERGKHFFQGDDVEQWGFIAHELQETLVSSAASGVKDQADCIQSINPAPIMAALTKALQEAMARIETMQARLDALEVV
jgi:Chaperone of endosialidase